MNRAHYPVHLFFIRFMVSREQDIHSHLACLKETVC